MSFFKFTRKPKDDDDDFVESVGMHWLWALSGGPGLLL
jgi:hypothetical protein